MSVSRPGGLVTKIYKLCLEFLWRDFMKKLDTIIEEAILWEKMKLDIGSHMLTLHIICLLQ